MIHPIVLWQLARNLRNGRVPSRPRQWPTIRRHPRRRMDRPGRRLATDDAGLVPGVVDSRPTRSDWMTATCDAPNCAGHRTRA